MVVPDYYRFRNVLQHSAKGSEWKDHKYIKRIDGTYYYPDNYEGGRHLDDKSGLKSESKTGSDLSEDDAEKLAKEVILGNFGNGQVRKDLLGENYDVIQKRVNELMKTKIGSKKIPSDKTTHINVAEEAAKKALSIVDSHRNKKNK